MASIRIETIGTSPKSDIEDKHSGMIKRFRTLKELVISKSL